MYVLVMLYRRTPFSSVTNETLGGAVDHENARPQVQGMGLSPKLKISACYKFTVCMKTVCNNTPAVQLKGETVSRTIYP